MKEDMIRSIFSPRMLLVIIIVFLVQFRPFIQYGVFYSQTELDYLYLLTLPSSLSGLAPFAVLIPVIPYATSFSDEYNSGFFRLALIRSKKNKYCFSKVLSTFLSGGIAMFIPFLLITLLIIAVGVPTTQAVSFSEDYYIDTIWSQYMYSYGGSWVLLGRLILAFLFGAVWSLVGLAISVIISNRYIILLGPFVIYQALWMLCSKMQIGPIKLLYGMSNISLYVMILIQMTLIIITSFLSFYGIRKRVEYA